MKRWTLFIALAALLCLPLVQADTGANEITVGVTASLSGKYAELGQEQLNGMQMWADDLNARGALLARKVRIVYYDDQSSPEKTAELYDRLINQDRVDLLLGPYSSELTLVAAGVAEKNNFPMLAAGAGASEIWSQGYRNIFQLETPADQYMDHVIDFAAGKGLKRIALLYEDTEFPREVAEGVREQAAEHGLDIVFDEDYAEDISDFSPLIRQAKGTSPDMLICGTYFEDSVDIVRVVKASGLEPKILVFTVGPALREFGDTLGDDADGVMGVVQWLRSGRLPMARDFSFRYKDKYGFNAGPHAASGYAAGQVLEAAVRLAGSLDKDQVRDQLGSLKFQSLIGHYRIGESGEQIGKQSFVLQWKDGFRLLILPTNIAESEAKFPLQPWSER